VDNESKRTFLPRGSSDTGSNKASVWIMSLNVLSATWLIRHRHFKSSPTRARAQSLGSPDWKGVFFPIL